MRTKKGRSMKKRAYWQNEKELEIAWLNSDGDGMPTTVRIHHDAEHALVSAAKSVMSSGQSKPLVLEVFRDGDSTAVVLRLASG